MSTAMHAKKCPSSVVNSTSYGSRSTRIQDSPFQVLTTDQRSSRPPCWTEMFGLAALYSDLVGETRLPPGVIVRAVDNGLDFGQLFADFG